MKNLTLFIIAIFIFVLTMNAQQKEFCELTGPYLGQKLSGAASELFAPGIISKGLDENGIAFMPEVKECYWTIMFSRFETIAASRLENGKWTEPELAPFAGIYYDGWPAIQPDGKRMFFHSSRPVNDSTSGINAKYNRLFVDRIGNSWSEPMIVGSPVNGSENATCPSVTDKGTLYFSKRFSDGTEKICRSKLVEGKYAELEILPDCINTGKDNFHAFISPDEDYIVMPAFGRTDAIGGGCNYYVSFKEGDNNWSELINLGEKVNSALCWGIPSISCDGKYFFFQVINPGRETSELDRRYTLKDLIEKQIHYPAANCTDINWINAEFIKELRPIE
ncbi:MAG: hypothetical protein V1720_12375 [bacterium]